MPTENSDLYYTTLTNSQILPETLTGTHIRAYSTPEEAIHRGGLWRKAASQRLVRVRPVGQVIENINASTIMADSYQVLGLSNVDGPLYSLSRAFGSIADEMYVEQAAWRRALMRPIRDPEKVHQLLENTLDFRGLDLWTLQRLDSVDQLQEQRDLEAMYSWAVLFAQVAFEAWRDEALENTFLDNALRTGWSTWFDSHYWDDLEYAANPDSNDSIDWVCWDAWAALTVFYTANERLCSFPSDLLTRYYRDAFQNGLKIAAPIGAGILGYCV